MKILYIRSFSKGNFCVIKLKDSNAYVERFNSKSGIELYYY